MSINGSSKSAGVMIQKVESLHQWEVTLGSHGDGIKHCFSFLFWEILDIKTF